MKNPFPPTRTCSIETMLLYASNTTRVSKQKRVNEAVQFALSNISQLNRVPKMRWKDRKRAIKGLAALDKIGITETLELLPAKPVTFSPDVNDLGKVAEALGLHLFKINGAVIVTRTALTVQPKEVRSLAEMPVSERGDSSPQLPLV